MRFATVGFDSGQLKIEERNAEPHLQEGEALVKTHTSYVAPFVPFVCDPATTYVTPERPFSPGMDPVGTVVAVGDGVDRIVVGDGVYGDVFIDGDWDGHLGEAAFAGNFALSGKADRLFACYRDGAFASHIVLPQECLTKIGPALGRRPNRRSPAWAGFARR